MKSKRTTSLKNDTDLIKQNQVLTDALQTSQQINQALQTQVEQLTRQLDWFKKQLFGRKSEKRLIESAPEQLSLDAAIPTTESDTVPQQSVSSYQRGKQKKDRGQSVSDKGLRFDDSVPMEVIYNLPPEIEGLSPDQFEVIDEKVVYRLAQLPGNFIVVAYKTPVIKLKENQTLLQAPALPAVLEKSQYEVSFIAGLLVDKLVYHLPLYRLHQRLALNGIKVSRSSLSHCFHRAAALLEPIYEAQLRSILQSKVLAMDETAIKAGRKEKGKMRAAYYWPLYGDRDEIAFVYTDSRSITHAETILDGFEGTLISDGYIAYERYVEKYTNTVHAQCWAHTRRKFINAEDAEPRLSGEALERIGSLYQVEEEIRNRNLTGDAKQQYRLAHSKDDVESLFLWLKTEVEITALLPTNPFLEAANYALKRQLQLSVFLENPDVALDTNHVERELRVIPMGRKAWLFCWTEIGAHYLGLVQSLLTTCKLHGINPYDYLVDVLQRIDHHPMSRVEELTPINWKKHFADNPLKSDLYRVWPKNHPPPV